MTDQFLQAHQLAPYLFSIGGSVGPTVSIRDQMIRGLLIVDRLIQEKLLVAQSLNQNPLVIVGAGAGGATAFLRAISWGIPALLVERWKAPFQVQTNCLTRWIDPVMYDWPMDHYSQGQIPWPPPPPQTVFPLSWSANFADQLVANWVHLLGTLPSNAFFYDHDFLNAYTSIPQATAATGPPLIVQIRDRSTGNQRFLPASALVLAIGFGKERCWAGPDNNPNPARGFPFWRDDRWYTAGFGLQGTAPRVLISGSGDGALQDFIRVVTRPQIDQTTQRAYHSARSIYDFCSIPLQIEHEIQSHQDYAQRLLVWGGSKQFEHAVQQELQNVHHQLSLLALNGPGVRAALHQIVWPKPEMPYVRLAHSCTHFTNYYPLNRFVTLLLTNFFEQEYQITDILFPEHRLKNIACQHPTPSHDAPIDCWGGSHLATFDQHPECWQDEITPENPPTCKANVLFLRHGIKALDFEKRVTPPFARQMLPYSLPHL
jgi:hypothetical protein